MLPAHSPFIFGNAGDIPSNRSFPMSEAALSHKRRNYFIKKEFQVRFIIKFCLILLAGIAISSGLLFILSRDTLTTTFDQSRLVIENTGLAILPSLIYTNLITLALVTLATIFVTLFTSHKIAGPLFRLEKELKDIGEGNLAKVVTLRKNDQTAEMARSLNQMTRNLNAKVSAVKQEVDDLHETAVREKAPQAVVTRLQELRHRLATQFTL